MGEGRGQRGWEGSGQGGFRGIRVSTQSSTLAAGAWAVPHTGCPQQGASCHGSTHLCEPPTPQLDPITALYRRPSLDSTCQRLNKTHACHFQMTNGELQPWSSGALGLLQVPSWGRGVVTHVRRLPHQSSDMSAWVPQGLQPSLRTMSKRAEQRSASGDQSRKPSSTNRLFFLSIA